MGGLAGQPVKNYLKADWIEKLHADPAAYRFADWKEEPLARHFAWKKRPEWLSRDLPWPPPGKQVDAAFRPARASAGKNAEVRRWLAGDRHPLRDLRRHSADRKMAHGSQHHAEAGAA